MFDLFNIAIALTIAGIVLVFVKAIRQTKARIDEKLKGVDPAKRDEILKKMIQQPDPFADSRNNFDPSRLGDPVAVQTAWTPAKGGGASFRTHNSVKMDTNRLEFRPSMGARIFYMVFFFMGAGIAVGFSSANVSQGTFSLNFNTVFPILFGLVFTVIGGCLYYFGTKPVVFDRRRGSFWKGRTDPDAPRNVEIKDFARFENIHALQLISEHCRSDEHSYTSYELNLVLQDGNRINVIDHGDIQKLREDARKLSHFLDKPLWDAV